MSSAATFMQLPCELRAMIWDDSMPEDVSEVCILPPEGEETGRHIEPDDEEDDDDDDEMCCPGQSFTVDTAFPVLMHICHESRAHALRHARLRFSPAAGVGVPFRAFRPDLDVLYIPPGRSQAVAASQEHHPGGKAKLFGRVRHVALAYWRPLCTSTPAKPPSASCVFQGFPRVQSISVVVPSSTELPSQRRLYSPVPAGRCRLEPFFTGAAGKTNIIAAFRDVDRDIGTVLGFLNRIHCDIACYHMSRWRVLGPRSDPAGEFIDMSLSAQYFTAWSHEASPGGQSAGSFLDNKQYPEGFEQRSAYNLTG
ncbi:hypothetical protein LQW54_004443 [Pestalotiopsis sp. IQ-011]